MLPSARRLVPPLAAFGLAALVLSVSCTDRTANTAAAAAGAAAMHVGLTAVHRGATGDCWGACAYGTVCNHETGMCDPMPEDQGRVASPPVVAPGGSAAATAPPAPPPPPPSCPFTDPRALAAADQICSSESALCRFAHDECIGQCSCSGARWDCSEQCR